MFTRIAPVLALGMLCSSGATAQDKIQPKDTEVAAHWIYDDVPTAFARAKETGKPILALFR